MPKLPEQIRAIAFIDGQNLYHAVKSAFGYSFPNYDVKALAQTICARQGWRLAQTRFYTGVPSLADNHFWHRFWSLKLGAMRRRRDMFVYSRSLRYMKKRIRQADGSFYEAVVGDEKGIDVRIAIDVISLAHQGKFDVALVFSQDQDLSEVADEIRTIAKSNDRWIKIASAFPLNPNKKNRGINKTDWVNFDKTLYDACIDHRDYRPKQGSK